MFESGLVDSSVRVFASTEMVMSILGFRGDSARLESSPSDYIYEVSGAEAPDDVSIDVVYNTLDSINLVLPYYGMLDMSSRSSLSDSAMAGVSGGCDDGYSIEVDLADFGDSISAAWYGMQVRSAVDRFSHPGDSQK